MHMHMHMHMHISMQRVCTLNIQYIALVSKHMINLPRHTNTCDHNGGMAELPGLCS